MASLRDLTPELMLEGMDFLCGDKLGSGMTRDVYKLAFDDTKVIKVENSRHYFQNVKEYEIWRDNCHYKAASKWLCPVRYISHSGTFLIMDYARDLLPEEMPKRVPSFMVDTKLENFGMLNGRVVLRDYGTTIINLGLRLKKQ